jgi:PPOX class probable F420-dependent enzyme
MTLHGTQTEVTSSMAEIPDAYRGLLDAEVGILATFGPDGYPQVTAVWFYNDHGAVRLSLNTARQKVANLRRDPRCTLFIQDPGTPYRYLEIRGDAEIFQDDDYCFADRVAKKYQTDYRTVDAPEETRVCVTVHPTKVNTFDIDTWMERQAARRPRFEQD